MQDAVDILRNLSALFAPLQGLVDQVTIFAGFSIAAYAAWTVGRRSRRGEQVPFKGVAWSMIIGSLLLSAHYFMNGVTYSSFGGGEVATALSYDASGSGDAATLIVHWVLDFAALCGWIFGLVGGFLIHRSGHPEKAQPGDFRSGATRLFGAWMCCNLLLLTNAAAHTGGFNNPLAL